MFYMLAPGGEYYNYSGCGNTVNCNHPLVRRFLLDCLRYWVSEYHVDGFRCASQMLYATSLHFPMLMTCTKHACCLALLGMWWVQLQIV